MKITFELPKALEEPLRAKAIAEGCDLPEAVLALLKESLLEGPLRKTSTLARLKPGVYPDAKIIGEIEPYQAVPLPLAGSVTVRLVPASALTPPKLPAE